MTPGPHRGTTSGGTVGPGVGARLPSRTVLEASAGSDASAGNHLAVFGESGSGRTVFATRVAQSFPGRVHRLTGVAPLRDVPFAALAALPALTGGADPEGLSPARLIAALAADGGARALVIDDAEFVDDASAAVFAQAALGGTLQLMVLGTAPERLSAPLRAFASRCPQYRLEPITLDDARIVVAEALGAPLALHDTDRLRQLAGQNPRYLYELALDARDSGAVGGRDGHLALCADFSPGGRRIGELVAMRLMHQSPAVRDATILLAVTGEIPRHLADALTSAETIDQAIETGLVQAVPEPVDDDGRPGESVRIGGGLTSDTVLAGVAASALRRHAEHALDFSDQMHPQTVIGVVLHASRVGIAFDLRTRETVAREAVRARLFDAALAIGAPVDEETASAGLRLLRSRALFETRRYDEAFAVLAPVDPEDVPARVWFATMCAGLGRIDELRRSLQPGPGDTAHVRELTARRDVLLAKAGVDVSEDVLRAHARDHGLDTDLGAGALQAAVMLTILAGRPEDAAAEIGAAMASPTWSEVSPTEQGDLLISLFFALAASGSLTGAIADLGDAGWAALKIPPALYLGAAGVRALDAGDAQTAADYLGQALASNDGDIRFGLRAYFAAGACAAAALLGDRDTAGRLRDVAETAGRVGGALHDETRRLLLPAHLLVDGPEHAGRIWRPLYESTRDRGRRYLAMRVLHDGWRLGLHDDLDALSDTAAGVQGPLAAALARYPTAVSGDPVALSGVVADHTRTGHTLFAAEIAAASARSVPRSRRAAVRNVEVPPGVDTPILGRTRIDRSCLSEREYEVCVAAASGATSTEIAERLFLSARTVEGHLQRAFGKLGVSNRRQLAPPAPVAARLHD